MQFEVFFKIGYVCTIPKGMVVEQDLTQLAVIILCDDATSWDEVGDYFATEADTMIDDIVCEVYLNRD